MWTEAGRLRCSSGSWARTPLTIVSGLPDGVAEMPIKTACWPFIMTLEVQLCAARSTVAMSPIRTSASPLALTTMFLNWATSVSPVFVLTLVTV